MPKVSIKRSYLVAIFASCLLPTLLLSQDYEKNHSFNKKVYKAIVKKSNVFQFTFEFESKKESFELTDLSLNTFTPLFDGAFQKLGINDGKRETAGLYEEHRQSVFMDIYVYFISSQQSNDPQAGWVYLQDTIFILPELSKDIIVPSHQLDLIAEIDYMNQRIFEEILHTNCCDTCNCKWWESKATLYHKLFSDEDYYLFISNNLGKQFPLMRTSCRDIIPCSKDGQVKPCETIIAQLKIQNSGDSDPIISILLDLLTKIEQILIKIKSNPSGGFSNGDKNTITSATTSTVKSIDDLLKETTLNAKYKKELEKMRNEITKFSNFINGENLLRVTTIIKELKKLRLTIHQIIKTSGKQVLGLRKAKRKKLQRYFVERKLLLNALIADNDLQDIKCCELLELEGKINKIPDELEKKMEEYNAIKEESKNVLNKINRVRTDLKNNLDKIQKNACSGKIAFFRIWEKEINYSSDSLARISDTFNLKLKSDTIDSPDHPNIDNLIQQINRLSTKDLKSLNHINTIDSLCNQLIDTIFSLRCDQIPTIMEAITATKICLEKLKTLKEEIEKQGIKLADVKITIDGYKKSYLALQDIKKEKRQQYPLKTLSFITDSVQLEFSDGLLKNIIVMGKRDGKAYILVNRYPVPFSVLSNLERFQYINLHEPYKYTFKAKLVDIMKYIPRLQKHSDDYSPVDGVYNAYPRENPKILYKEKSIEILRGKIFTDAIGFGGDQPNGLIQTEVGRRFNLYSRYFPVFYKSVGKTAAYKVYAGFVNYMEPFLLISKIEGSNRKISSLTTSIPFLNDQIKYAGTLDYFKFMNFYFKPININIVGLFIPSLKSSMHLDFGAAWARTDITDTLKTTINNTTEIKERTSTVNSTVFNLSLLYHLRPDTRYGLTITNQITFWKTWSPDFYQSGDTAAFKFGIDMSQRNWIYSLQLNAFYRPFSKEKDFGEVYFRFTYNTLIENFAQNFMQAQLGYAFRILYK